MEVFDFDKDLENWGAKKVTHFGLESNALCPRKERTTPMKITQSVPIHSVDVGDLGRKFGGRYALYPLPVFLDRYGFSMMWWQRNKELFATKSWEKVSRAKFGLDGKGPVIGIDKYAINKMVMCAYWRDMAAAHGISVNTIKYSDYHIIAQCKRYKKLSTVLDAVIYLFGKTGVKDMTYKTLVAAAKKSIYEKVYEQNEIIIDQNKEIIKKLNRYDDLPKMIIEILRKECPKIFEIEEIINYEDINGIIGQINSYGKNKCPTHWKSLQVLVAEGIIEQADNGEFNYIQF